MTVDWNLSQDDMNEAIKQWLLEKFEINAEGAKVRFYYSQVTDSYKAVVSGVVEQFSQGPYR